MSQDPATTDALLLEIYDRSRGRDLTAAMLRGMLKQYFAPAQASGKDVTAAYARMEQLVDKLPLREATTQALRENLSEPEILSMVELYRSPLGTRFARFGVDSAEEVADLVQRWAQEKVIIKTLVAAGLGAEAAASLGIDVNAHLEPADWSKLGAGREAARSVVSAMGFADRIEEMVKTQSDALVQQGISPVVVSEADRELLMDRVAHIYASYFSVDELKQLAAFYTTPFGHRFVAITPMLGQAGQLAIEQWTAAHPGQLEAEIGAIVELLA